MKYFIFLIILLARPLIAQDFDEQELKTSIDDVTVYLQSGLITRKGTTEISSGQSVLVMKSLSPFIDAKSVQVQGTGAFTILAVNHRLNYVDRMGKNERIKKLNRDLDAIALKRSSFYARLEVLDEKFSLLDKNKRLGSRNAGAHVSEIKQAMEFYDKELMAIKTEEIKINVQMGELDNEKADIQKEIDQTLSDGELPTGEIEIRVEANEKTTGSFTVSYLVANTGWHPKYDIRVKSLLHPLTLKYKADIYQNTGVDWKNVKLRMSNANPNQTGVAPALIPWRLNYARNTIIDRQGYTSAVTHMGRIIRGKVIEEDGTSLPGVSVTVLGTSVGTITDLDGDYELTLPVRASHLSVSFVGYVPQELPITGAVRDIIMKTDYNQLDEVMVVGYSSAATSMLNGSVSGISVTRAPRKAKRVVTTTIENQTSVDFEVPDRYSIQSNKGKLTVDLNSYDIKASYEYYAVPKLDKDAFLMAQITDWDQYNLLDGEANLYFEDAYIGRSILDARSLSDTMHISLGRDKNIVLGRKKVDVYAKRSFIGANKVDHRGFEILVRNKKAQTIKLTLFDQIPVAAISDIVVTPTVLSGGNLDEKTGELEWKLAVEPNQQSSISLNYEVKYPKREIVNLE